MSDYHIHSLRIYPIFLYFIEYINPIYKTDIKMADLLEQAFITQE